jgi:type I restriction enzyme R subunit
VQRFKRFLEERRDELAALQILYRLPYAQRRLAVDDLKEALKRPPWLLEPVDIWRAYKRLASDKVRGNPAGTLADIVMLVRYAIGNSESLEPLPSVIAGFFMVTAMTSGSSPSFAAPWWKRLLSAPQASRAAFIDGAAIA